MKQFGFGLFLKIMTNSGSFKYQKASSEL